MSITATLTRLDRVKDKWLITILYTDTISNDTVEKTYNYASITKKQLRDIARADAAALASNETNDVDIPIGTTIDVTPDPVIPPAPPTQAEIDKATWFDECRQLKQIQQVFAAVPAIETPARTTIMTDLQTGLQSGWKNSYFGDI